MPTSTASPSLFPHPGIATRIVADAARTEGAYALLEMVAPPGAGAPLHLHEREDQIVLVLEGTLDVRVDGRLDQVPAGASIVLPRGVPHAYVAGARGARFLCICTPAGFEDLVRSTMRDEDGWPDADDLAALMAAAGVRSLEARA